MGDCTDRYAFTAFGELIHHEGQDPQAYLFAGEMLDPNSGFYYNRARWMDPGSGRFASMDPFAGRVFDPVTLHKYLYAAADPVLKVDPTGLMTGNEMMLVGAIIGIIAAQIFISTSPQEFTTGEKFLILFVGGALGAAAAALYAFAAGASIVGFGGGAAAGAGGAAGAAAGAGAQVPEKLARFDWGRAGHIFRQAAGHVNPLYESTKIRFVQLFQYVGSNPSNYRPDYGLPTGAQQAGVQAYTQTFSNGQVWVYVLRGVIVDAGVNRPGAFR